jgi:hypothetical protein
MHGLRQSLQGDWLSLKLLINKYLNRISFFAANAAPDLGFQFGTAQN